MMWQSFNLGLDVLFKFLFAYTTLVTSISVTAARIKNPCNALLGQFSPNLGSKERQNNLESLVKIAKSYVLPHLTAEQIRENWQGRDQLSLLVPPALVEQFERLYGREKIELKDSRHFLNLKQGDYLFLGRHVSQLPQQIRSEIEQSNLIVSNALSDLDYDTNRFDAEYGNAGIAPILTIQRGIGGTAVSTAWGGDAIIQNKDYVFKIPTEYLVLWKNTHDHNAVSLPKHVIADPTSFGIMSDSLGDTEVIFIGYFVPTQYIQKMEHRK